MHYPEGWGVYQLKDEDAEVVRPETEENISVRGKTVKKTHRKKET